MKQLVKAITAVMKEVKGIDKNLTVGNGSSAYKGVSDQDVKKIIGEAMERNGLSIIPTSVEPTLRIDRWEETYNGQTKQKQQVFSEVRTKYLLMHESGESIELSGYGHGVDTQDKAAGKATTYALKYALLYTFLVPTGKIDDADAVHSEAIEVPKKQSKERMNEQHQLWGQVCEAVTKGSRTVEQIKEKFLVSDKVEEQLRNLVNQTV